MFGQIQTRQTEGQTYSDTSPYKVSEYSMAELLKSFMANQILRALLLGLPCLQFLNRLP